MAINKMYKVTFKHSIEVTLEECDYYENDSDKNKAKQMAADIVSKEMPTFEDFEITIEEIS